MNTRSFLTLMLGLMLAGCATPKPLRGRPDLLNFLEDGKSTREEVLTTLGQPSGRFESERILTYQLGYEPRNNGYYLVERHPTAWGWPAWNGVQFSLVLVFDDGGVLRKRSLVKVNQ
jgi:hypothetical protein